MSAPGQSDRWILIDRYILASLSSPSSINLILYLTITDEHASPELLDLVELGRWLPRVRRSTLLDAPNRLD